MAVLIGRGEGVSVGGGEERRETDGGGSEGGR